MKVGLMVAGQFGLTWQSWLHVLALVERLGFHSVFRSDHYYTGQQQASLETFISLAVAAGETQRVRFGPLVSPVTFRHPVDVGRMAAQIDLLSGGRFVMGLGAGFAAPEYTTYGIPLPPTRERFDRLDEAIRLMRALWSDGPADFDGQFYQLKGADCLPKPAAGRPPILIGGTGERRTLQLVARYADEWNAVVPSAEVYAAKNAVLEKHCAAAGRDPATIRRSIDLFALVGPTEHIVDEATRRIMSWFGSQGAASPAEYRQREDSRGQYFGGTDELLDYLGRLAQQGADEAIFQHFLFEHDDVPEYLAAEIAPQVAKF